MSDILVTPWRSGWTVRHESILFERFDSRSAALNRAYRLSSLLQARGESARLRCESLAKPAR
ncbi:hypothetical protein [Caulobacter sp. S45]|uniref:hypothetical protein n=1 Tax=Caulobacter sp. S45 TaxID=1641861 RepID=UPI001576EEEF|nr:hypothetical protein [Caulobacter sp. S45]